MDLVELNPNDDEFELQLAYASENNFTGKAIYNRSVCLLHKDAAVCMRRAIKLAKSLGLRFKIFDAFRPMEAQFTLWNIMPDTNYVADPHVGSPHSRGVAVDLTLIDEQDMELPMGTNFDDFTSDSHHGCQKISSQAQRNRFVLLGIMTASGWDFYKNEWWHYQLFNCKDYRLLSDSMVENGLLG